MNLPEVEDTDLSKCERCGKPTLTLYDSQEVATEQICDDCYNATDMEPDPVPDAD